MESLPDSTAADQKTEPDLIGGHEEQDGAVDSGRRTPRPSLLLGNEEELEIHGELHKERDAVDDGVLLAAPVS